MKLLKIKLALFLAIIGFATACVEDDESQYCNYTFATAVTAVTGPETATVNQEITFNVTFETLSGCPASDVFNESSGFPKVVNVIVNYTGCNCTQDPTVITRPYVFKQSQPGTYILKFFQGNSTYITKTVTVTE